MFCDSEWKDSKTFQGGNGCFLFQLERNFSILRPKGGNSVRTLIISQNKLTE